MDLALTCGDNKYSVDDILRTLIYTDGSDVALNVAVISNSSTEFYDSCNKAVLTINDLPISLVQIGSIWAIAVNSL